MLDGRSPLQPADALPAEQVDAVRAALDRISRSDMFRKAPQLLAFLAFVVDKRLVGEAQDIKGYTIATQALGRSDGFDPQSDPIVRVEAGRLRRALDAYYTEAGLAEPVRITIPRGSYVPEFSFLTPFDTQPDSAPPADWDAAGQEGRSWPALLRPRPSLIASAILLLLLAVASGVGWWRMSNQPAAGLARHAAGTVRDLRPVVELLPIEASAEPAGLSRTHLRNQLLDALARFKYLAVTERSPTPAAEGEHYLLNLRLNGASDGTAVMVRLTHRGSGRVAWVRTFGPIEGASGETAEDKLAGQIATALATPGGALHTDLRRWVRVPPPVACVLRGSAYWLAPEPKAHVEVVACLEAMAAADPDAAIARAMLAVLYVDQYHRGVDLQEEPLEKALRAARHAIGISPDSARAQLAMMAVLLARGEVEAALQHGERAVELNPFDMSVRADLGARYVQIGRYQHGLDLLRQAAAAVPSEPPRYDFHRFVGAYMLGDEASAQRAASQILTSGDPLGLVARALAAAMADRADEARVVLERLATHHQDFARAPAAALARYGFAPEIVERLARGLREAGLRT